VAGGTDAEVQALTQEAGVLGVGQSPTAGAPQRQPRSVGCTRRPSADEVVKTARPRPRAASPARRGRGGGRALVDEIPEDLPVDLRGSGTCGRLNLDLAAVTCRETLHRSRVVVQR
jgi:hypothetical protein